MESKFRCRIGISFVLTAVCCFPAALPSAAGTPSTVRISIAQEAILPGDLVEVELTSFRDDQGTGPHALDRIILTVDEGEIVDGVPTQGIDLAPIGGTSFKAFFVGDGNLEVRYRAPYVCPQEKKDKLSVWSGRWAGSAERTPLSETDWLDPIGSRDIPLVCPSYALLKYGEYVHSDDGNETSTLDFDLILRLELVPTDALDTLAIGSVAVLRHEGVDRYQYRDDPPEILRLASASIAGRGHTVRLHRSRGDGKISAVVFPLISVGLEWSGEAGFVPPETAEVQPVTAEDESQEARFEKLADHLETVVDGVEEGSVSDYAQVMQAFSHLSAAQLRPDHEVVQGDGLSYCAGKGEFEEELEDGVVKRTFEWELFLDR